MPNKPFAKISIYVIHVCRYGQLIVSMLLPLLGTYDIGPYKRTSKEVISHHATFKMKVEELTLDILLGDKNGLEAFSQHLVREFSTENIEFWKEAKAFGQRFNSVEGGGGA